MALPTTNLTLHGDASDTDKLFTTYDSGGNHTGTPGDGDEVHVWDDEGDGISNVAIMADTGTKPTYRSSSPLMKLPCLDFDGSVDTMSSFDQVGNFKNVSNFYANNNKTLAVVFYPESITASGTDPSDRHALISTDGVGDVFGLALYDSGGTKKIQGFNFDGNYDIVELTVATGRTWIAILTHSGGTLTLTLIDDAGSETTGNVASGNTSSLLGDLGVAQGGALAEKYNGRLGELVTYNAGVSGTDLTDLKNYFKDKWLTTSGAAVNPWNYYAQN